MERRRAGKRAWNVGENWSTDRVPTEFEDVYIADISTSGNFYPITSKQVIVIPHLFVQGNARLTIANTGILLNDGSNTYNNGILNYGTIRNNGQLIIKNVAIQRIVNENGGKIIGINQPSEICHN